MGLCGSQWVHVGPGVMPPDPGFSHVGPVSMKLIGQEVSKVMGLRVQVCGYSVWVLLTM